MRKFIQVVLFTLSIACTAAPGRAGVDRFTSISPEGADISRIVIDPLQPSTIYAAASHAGVFKSIDSGETWTLVFDLATVNEELPWRVIGPMVIDPRRPSTVYATISSYGGGKSRGGILKTEDAGSTWSLLPGWPATQLISELVIDPSSPNTLYAVTRADLLQSTDGGLSWRSKAAGLRTLFVFDILSLAIDPSKSRIYAGTSRGLYVSNDQGEIWQLVHFGRDFHRLAFDPADPATLHAAYSGVVASSLDGGTTWTAGRGAEWVAQIVVDPASSVTYAITARWQYGVPATIVRTTDRGKTWDLLPASEIVPSFLAIGAGSFYGASRGALWKSENRGTSWRSIHRGLVAPFVVDIAIDPADERTIFAGTPRGLHKSSDGGQSWRDVKLDLPSARVSIDPKQTSTVFAFTNEAASRSNDGGESWKAIDPGKYVSEIAVDPSDSANVYAVLTDGLSRSRDGGSTWTAVGIGQLPLGYYGFEGGAIAIDPVTPSTVYAAGGEGIVKSVDSGTTWKTVLHEEAYFRKLVIDPAAPSTIYALGFNRLYRSYNEGNTWHIAFLRPSQQTYFTDLDLDARNPSRLYLATNTGLLKSENGGNSWTGLNEGLPTPLVTSVMPDRSGNVYAGTARGLFVNTPRLESVTLPSISLRTLLGNYVSANDCGGSFVHASAITAGPCEMFTIYDLNGGALNDGDRIHLRASNGQFVAAEDGGRLDSSDAPVNANRRLPAAWETFVIRRKGGGTTIASGDSIALQSVNGTYLAAEGGGANNCNCDSRLNANRFEAREWETFVITNH